MQVRFNMKKRMIATLISMGIMSMPFGKIFDNISITAYAKPALGDVNRDGVVNIADAYFILRECAYKSAGLSSTYKDYDFQFWLSDIDQDGEISIKDASYILKYCQFINMGSPVTWGDIIPPELQVSMDGINSEYVMLVDAKTGAVYGEKNSAEALFPASMTKIMTAVLTIEAFQDTSQIIKIPSDIFYQITNEIGSTADFEAEEEVTILDLLYGMLLPSGCECCLAAAIHSVGSESAFVELMNRKAQLLGMKNTHFANCTGLPNENHYTTAEDMSILMRYALQSKLFREIVSTRSYYVSPTNIHEDGLYFNSTLFKPLGENTEVVGGELIGGKTGSTDEAGYCLTSFASIYGKEYVLVTAKAYENRQHLTDTMIIYNRLGDALYEKDGDSEENNYQGNEYQYNTDLYQENSEESYNDSY